MTRRPRHVETIGVLISATGLILVPAITTVGLVAGVVAVVRGIAS